MNAVIYTRVSTEEQAKHGYSLAKQELECKNFAVRNGYDILKIFKEEGVSAKSTNRPKLQELIKYCIENKKFVDYIIVWRFDRFTRNLEDQTALFSKLSKYGIRVLSVTENNEENATGNLMRNIIGSFAQYENDVKSERVKAGMQQAFLEGNWLWKAPIGYKMVNKKLYQDDKTAPIIRKVFEDFATGMYRQTDLLQYLKENNIKLSANSLCELLRRPLYYGYLVNKKYSDIPVKANFEPIIDEKTFYTVQAILNGNKSQAVPHLRQNPIFPLKQFITCPYCNQPLTGDTPHGRNGQKYYYYRCYNKDCIAHFNIAKDALENKFVEHLSKIKPEKSLLKLFKAIMKDTYNKSTKEAQKTYETLNKQLEEVNEKKSKLLDLLISDIVSKDDYNMKTAQYEAKEADLKSKIAVCDIPQNNFEDCINYACNILDHLDTFWLNSKIEIKERLQKIIFPNGLRYESGVFRNSEMSSLFKIIGTLSVPYINMVPPSEFESLSTP
jgi:serine type site-specific recombinase